MKENPAGLFLEGSQEVGVFVRAPRILNDVGHGSKLVRLG